MSNHRAETHERSSHAEADSVRLYWPRNGGSLLQVRMAEPVVHLSISFIKLATCKIGCPTFVS